MSSVADLLCMSLFFSGNNSFDYAFKQIRL